MKNVVQVKSSGTQKLKTENTISSGMFESLAWVNPKTKITKNTPTNTNKIQAGNHLWDVWVSGMGELKIAESYRGRGKVATVVAPDDNHYHIVQIY